jgi:VWFA-related protein
MCLRRHCFLWLVLLSFLAPSLHAQNAPAKPAGDLPAIKSEVRIVLVDVVVTKGKGEPIPGLHKEDFQVLEDGQPQTISFFEEHKGPAPTQAKLPPMPANTFTNYPTTKTTDSINVLLLDMLNTPPRDQVYAREQMIKYLQNVQPGTRLAIFTLGSRLRMVLGVTANVSGLLTAFDNKKAETGPQSSRLAPTGAEDKHVIDAMVINQAAPAAIAALKDFQADFGAYLVDSRVKITLQAFQYIARYLSTFEGRKNLMWVSGSFPIAIFPTAGPRRRYQGEIQQTADLLTADQVAVYPIAAGGVDTNSTYDPDNDGKSPGEDNTSRGSRQVAMETLAQDTGGKAFYNTNGLSEALTDAVKNGAMYYTLTYTPTEAKMDGKYRRIQVKSLSGEYKLAYRRGYYAENAKIEQAADHTLSDDPLLPLVGFGMPDFAQILYKIRVLPTNPQPAPDASRAGINTELKGPMVRYGLDFAVSVHDLWLQTSPDGVRRGNIEVTFVAYDRTGKPLNLVSDSRKIALQPQVYAALQQKGLQLHGEIDVPEGDVYLRTGIYDLNSSKVGTLGIPLSNVATPKAAAN